MKSSMQRPKRSLLLVAACALTASFACSGAGAGGCSCLAPIPGGVYTGPKTDNPVDLRISEAGFSFLNTNWRTLIDTFAPGQTLHLPVSCALQQVASNYKLYIADSFES